jgi:hypothetical protein
MIKLKSIIKSLLPYGLIMQFRKMRSKKEPDKSTKINSLYSSNNFEEFDFEEFDFYEQLISDLVSYGLNEEQIRGGSIPFSSLRHISDLIKHEFENQNIQILHVGNYVGVSLVYITYLTIKYTSEESLVISIDPNLTHRGTSNPNEIVNKLLSKYKLDFNSLIITGYSLEKSISNDGNFIETGYDPFKEFEFENAPQNSILNLQKIQTNFIDLMIIDGNHEAKYLKSEIEKSKALLKLGGYIVLDDIDPENWSDLYLMYMEINSLEFKTILNNNRIVILKLLKN